MVTLAARGLSVSLARRVVLTDVDLAVGGGTLLGIVGPNGAGKSTLARVLLGLVRAEDGAVTLDGANIAGIAAATLARSIAYLAQGQTLHWPLTVERLVALGRLPYLGPFSTIGAEDQAAIESAMAEAGVTELRQRTATDLSGGERARAMLARALAVGAPALIVDEPLASLDPSHQLEVMALLTARARAGALVIVILHDLSMAARFCDRLVLLDNGRVAAEGPPAAVLTDERLASVYGITAWRGDAAGEPLIIPLHRTG